MAKLSKQDRIISNTLFLTLDLRGWIVAAVTVLAVWGIGILLPLRLAVLLSLLGMVASVVGLVISGRAIKALSKASPKASPRAGKRVPLLPVCLGGLLGSLLRFISTGNAYTFFNEPFYPFWKLSLILSLAIGIFATVKWVWRHAGFWLRLGSILALSLVAFFLTLILICHLNLVLDFEPPAEHKMVIAGKDEQYNRQSSDTYFFEFSVDGETFELEVGWLEYVMHDVGDTYTFKEYKGAFGKPFYMRD